MQTLDGDDYHHGHHPDGEPGSGDVVLAENPEEGGELGSGGAYDAYYADGKQGRSATDAGLDIKMNDKDRTPGGDKQGPNVNGPPAYDYLETEKMKLNKVFESYHPKVREDMLRDWMAKSRFQSYLNELAYIFKNMN